MKVRVRVDKVESSSLKVGLGFGLASGVITTLGLMIGIYASTLSRVMLLEEY